ncbi:HlyD family efflux transporter periplasmic adaptor subunit [Acidovorax sp. GBBC 3334]|nr:HlyD family efflux transporter periplasmic adaptor subunit [Acidovorax sp. GBBC 3334]MDA8456091.1 HlyD family efflux transporter periplasmic adaptor subunit [Acidovorax sp. GBBC 3334]
MCAAALAWALVLPAHAGPGHDHGEAPPAAPGNGPSRLPDGSVFLPKPAQRQLQVRTQPVAQEALARAHELAGRVVMDPNAGGKVQAMVAGRLEPGPRGLPQIGQAVRRGEVLAHVQPAQGSIERSGQMAQVAELRAARTLAERRLARLRELSETVPRKDIEAAESESTSLAARISALGSGLSGRDALVAPVDGVIASSNAVAGQVVDARELVFEVVDPQRLRIEALVYDAAVARDVAAASLAVDGERIPLTFLGAGRSLREQALPLLFSASGTRVARLAVGQPIAVFVQGAATVQGLRVPSASVLRNAANQSIVWVKTGPENFAPRPVTVEPLDGSSVAVTSGLAAGDRVVTQAATLLNQIR